MQHAEKIAVAFSSNVIDEFSRQLYSSKKFSEKIPSEFMSFGPSKLFREVSFHVVPSSEVFVV